MANLLRQLPFDPFRPAYFWLIVFAVLLVVIAIYALHKEQQLKKYISSVEKDEMTMRIGYTSLALTAQSIPFLILVLLLVEGVCPFLDAVGAENILSLLLLCILLVHAAAYYYYSRHPEKTWL